MSAILPAGRVKVVGGRGGCTGAVCPSQEPPAFPCAFSYPLRAGLYLGDHPALDLMSQREEMLA